MKLIFSLESCDINLDKTLFFLVQNPFLNVEMDSTWSKAPATLGLYRNNHSNLRIDQMQAGF
jgi:hypothetical protein